MKSQSCIKSNLIKISFIVLCLIGCLYHIIQITDVYLKFQTKIDVSLDSNSQIVVPLVSFCKDKHYLRNAKIT